MAFANRFAVHFRLELNLLDSFLFGCKAVENGVARASSVNKTLPPFKKRRKKLWCAF